MKKENTESLEPIGQDQPTTFLLSQVGAQAGMKFTERLTKFRLTPAQAGILFTLAREDGVNQRYLADRLGVVPSRLVVLVDQLENAGLVERGANTPDRRTHAINLTEAGQTMLGLLGELTRDHDEALLAALSTEEVTELRRLLEKVAKQQGLLPGVHPGYKLLGQHGNQ